MRISFAAIFGFGWALSLLFLFRLKWLVQILSAGIISFVMAVPATALEVDVLFQPGILVNVAHVASWSE